ncbi:two-component system regulatory protein YycI [Mechercharimyces sp. CAU 1602]|uniref:two-component system regulatory protein YycI n=1 Tax=Mechercharimyces sp. CAU 1602 TaxID=2973933 RepID=UPI00216365CA|nr:two-component system regulatory protein YycI [Mechercharimyces sp. CAU 1602]MCS1352661.1 two-component system regulatory protein YycI [Mechercharimyces sp. CAU 1602]
MDWNRAKTILIIAFAALNLFLAIQVYQTWEKTLELTDAHNITLRELEQLMEEGNIRLDTELPEVKPDEMILKATLKNVDDSWEAHDNYFKQTPENPIAVKDSKEIGTVLEEYVPDFDNYELDTFSSTSSRYVYQQQWDDLPLFDATLSVQLKEKQITSMHWVPFDITEESRSKEAIYSAQSALFALIERGDIPDGSVISDIRLGYHGKNYEAQTYDLLPSWRFTIAKGNAFYVNAFYGDVETVPSVKDKN